MNDEFIQHAKSRGDEGNAWIKAIPSIIAQYEKQWDIKVLPAFTLTYNYVAPAVRNNGEKGVIKIGFPKDQEFQTEIEALSLFDGEGAEKLLEADKEHAVMLLEQVIPGVPLSTLTDDDKATRILASVMKRLWKPLPEIHTLIPLTERVSAIQQYLEKYQGQQGPLPLLLVQKANDLLTHLLATAGKPIIIHGDLHQDNILSSTRTEWLAIDPKGIAAEPAFEVGAMIRNPYSKLNNNINKHILLKRITILSEELNIDIQRIYNWCFVQTVLSAVWSAEDEGKRWKHAIAVAQILSQISLF